MSIAVCLAGRFRRGIVALAPEVFALAGAGVISYGAWLVYQPAGFIVGGAFLLVIGIGSAKSAA